jgi:saxitoxin biosynthesis operon SxtJ-like protein
VARASGEIAHHEIDGRAVEVRRGSDRGFGLTFAVVFLVVGLAPCLSSRAPRIPDLIAATVLAGVALAAPRLLRPFARLWFRVGLAIHRVTGPIALGLVYFAVLTPTAWLLRARGRDPLRLRRDPRAATYWIERAPSGHAPHSMQRQF